VIDLRVPPAVEYASLISSVVDDAAARAELAGDRREALVTAARMGFELIVQQAMCAQREPIHLHARRTPAELRVSLHERGLPLDDTSARRDTRWDEIVSRVDRAQWHLHCAGSELQLAVKRPHGIANDGEVPPPAESVPLAPQQSYTIRRFQPEDAPGVARAFYQTWGYHYIFSAVYVPHRLVELNRTDAYISIVAAAENGEIVGHYALDPVPGAPIADCCAAIVVPAHRGRGLLERMRAATEQEAMRLGFAAYYSEPVTTHGRTQSESVKFGAQLCAIVLGGDPATFVPKAMDFTGAGQRQSYTVFFKPLGKRELRAIYAPGQHRGMIETIYANLDLPVDVRAGSPPTGDGELRVEIVRAEGFATIEIPVIGANTVDRIAQAVSDLKHLRRIGAIYVNLPLEDRATPSVCTPIERLGFFFCGVIPWGLAGRDALRLQLPLTPIDLSQVTIVGDFGERLKAYIGRQMATIQ
jgi:acetyltransferase (GNAT) family protein